MRRFFYLYITLFLLLVACGSKPVNSPTPEEPTITNTPTASPTLKPSPTGTASPTLMPSPSVTSQTLVTPITLHITSFEPTATNFDPASQTGAADDYVGAIYAGLVRLSPELEVVPDLAENWKISSDGTVYTFTLREGLAFQDGKHITAEDVRYSWERAADPDTGSPTARTYMGDITGVKDKLDGKADHISGLDVLDERTLQVTLDGPRPDFLFKLSYPVSFVVDKETVDNPQVDWFQPNASGPYTISNRETEGLTLERNAFYYSPANIEDINYSYYNNLPTDDIPSYFEAGNLDMTALLYFEDIHWVLEPYHPVHNNLVIETDQCTDLIEMNTALPPLDDINVRKALALAIDRDRLNDVTSDNLDLPAFTILPAGMPGYLEPLSKDQTSNAGYNPEAAVRALKSSRYAGRLPEIRMSNSLDEEYASILVSMWSETLGVEVSFDESDYDELDDSTMNETYHLILRGWCADYPDPANFLDILYSGDSDFNGFDIQDPLIHKQLEQARSELDNDRRITLYQDVERRLLEEFITVPTIHKRTYFLVSSNVEGFRYHGIGVRYLDQLTYTGHEATATQPTAVPTPPQNLGVKPSFNCSAPIEQGTATWRLAFISQDKLWLKEPEAEPRQLGDQGNLASVNFSPDGKQIIYSLRNKSGALELWIADLDSGKLHPLIQGKDFSQVKSIYSPIMSADQQYIAFDTEKEDGYDLWAVRIDGSGARRLVDAEDLKTFYGPGESTFYYIDHYAWVPGTHRLIFTPYWQDKTRYDPVRWVDAESGEFGIFLPESTGGSVTFSPDSRWMSVATDDRLYLASLVDSQPVTEIAIPYLEYKGDWVGEPVWSPDSSSVYVALPPQDMAVSHIDYTLPAPVVVWKLHVDGSAPEKLWSFTDDLGQPLLSPDFNAIAHVDDQSIQFEHVSGAHYTLPLPEDGTGMAFLGWSPDSRHFAYGVGTGSDVGYHAIGDVCGQDSIRLYKEDFMAGLMPGFLGWLDASRYIYVNYVFSGDWEAQLILGGIDEENVSRVVDINSINRSFVDYWSPPSMTP